MITPSLESFLKDVLCDEKANKLIRPLDMDSIYSVHEEIYEMKSALNLSTTTIIDAISTSGVGHTEGMSALAEINNIQKILNNIEVYITWCHTGGIKDFSSHLRSVK